MQSRRFLPFVRCYSSAAGNAKNEVFIVGGSRTPMGSFRGALNSFSGPRLGALAIEESLKRANCPKEAVEEVLMGNVLSASSGQAPDRQAALLAGISTSVPCTLINKVCASGMKSVMLAAESISNGRNDVMVAGGFESMSNVPFYLKRGETSYGGMPLVDGLVFDGLTDVYNKFHMGNCGENTAKKLSISREDQDEYAKSSYQRAAAAYKENKIQAELFPVSVPGKKRGEKVVFSEDEEYKKVNFEKFASLPTVFQREGGTVTAGNASTLSDGASAVVLMSQKALDKFGCKPLARVVDYSDGAVDPIDFPIAPVTATERLLNRTGLNKNDIDLWEINEAFSVVALANIKMLDLDPEKVNIHGGAVSLGHPLGSSGCRILVHLTNALGRNQKGISSICNGGGGASALLVEKL